MKVTFGQFTAFDTPGGIRFQENKKLTAEKNIPPEVVEILKKRLGQDTKQYERPSPEESAKLKEESMKVPEHLQLSPEEEAQRQETPIEEPLNESDFEEELPPDTVPDEQPADSGEVAAAEFMEKMSIHSASLEDIAQALYDRFGIYTVYLDKMPETDEINPLTATQFTKYHQGIAYQASVYAKANGLLNRNPEAHRKSMDNARAAHENVKDSFYRPETPQQKANTFSNRTSVEGSKQPVATEIVHVTGEDGVTRAIQRPINTPNGARSVSHPEEEEPLVQPRMGGKPVIRPNW